MSENKYCPLKFNHPQHRVKREEDWACDRECAWWDDFIGSCAILNISKHGASGSLDVMKKKSLATRHEGTEGK